MTKTEQALAVIEKSLVAWFMLFPDAPEKEALATLREAVGDYEKAKQDVIDESKRRAAIAESLGWHQVELEKVKAEVERLKKSNDSLRAALNMWEYRAEKAEAELERARPLLEAVMGAKLFPAPTDGRTCIDSHDKIIRAALAFRESLPKSDKEKP
jgi:septal ring factor EnvC (AmiA/AmiB activator)